MCRRWQLSCSLADDGWAGGGWLPPLVSGPRPFGLRHCRISPVIVLSTTNPFRLGCLLTWTITYTRLARRAGLHVWAAAGPLAPR